MKIIINKQKRHNYSKPDPYKCTYICYTYIHYSLIGIIAGSNASSSSPQVSSKPTKAFTFRRTDGGGLFGGMANDAGANTLGLDRDYTIIREKYMSDCDRVPGKILNRTIAESLSSLLLYFFKEILQI